MTPYETLTALCDQYLRPIAYWQAADGSTSLRGAAGLTPQFEPPLTTAEQATLADLVTMAKFGVTMTLAEWQSIKPEAATLKAYLGLTNPSAAQRLAYEKAVIRILAVIIRS